MSNTNTIIKAEAERLGFSFLHITHPSRPPHYQDYLDWLSNGYFAGMNYLATDRVRTSRAEPAILLEKAQSILVFGVRYKPLTRTIPAGEPYGLIASYALHTDYHIQLKQAAIQLMGFIQRGTARHIQYRIFVDSSALLEKDTAFMAGAGWIGRNSLLITPKIGSFQVLGCILTDLDLVPEPPFKKDLCEGCHRCQQYCPTGCITTNHNLRAEECIAYLTIEHKGVIPRHLRGKMGQWVFGCDVCQNRCPWNSEKKLQISNAEFLPIWESEPTVNLLEEVQLDVTAFEAKYRGSPVLRASYRMYRRNLIIAMGNSSSPLCMPHLEHILMNEPDAFLRLHAVWAMNNLNIPSKKILLQKALASETDEDVRAELQNCLNESV